MNRDKDSKIPILAIVFISVCSLLFYHLFYENREYYAVVDNTEVTKTTHGYKYSLKSYDSRGKSKKVSLKISHQLPNGLILKLKVSNTKIVRSWKQIVSEELPDELRFIYKNSESSFLLQKSSKYVNIGACKQKGGVKMDNYMTSLSKFLALILRHKPAKIGITLDEEGWVDVDELIEKMSVKTPITREILLNIIESDSKGRFSLSKDGSRLRAVNGHSVKVDVKPELITPPDILYHGTSMKSIPSIAKQGLTPMSRLYVHLSENQEIAREVGARHGQEIVLTIDAAAMVKDGLRIYRAENGVYLTDFVPTEYLRVLDLKYSKKYGKNF